jgi:GTP-binding protein
MVRSVRSIERCDVALLVMDANEGITEQDQRIAGIIKDYGKGAIILLNKWDTVENPDEAYEEIIEELHRKMWFSRYAQAITVSGLVKKRITKIFPLIDKIITERKKRVPTAELNRFFNNIISNLSVPMYKGRTVKMYYITQVKGEPPAFVIFANYKDAVKNSHLRFIEKGLREYFGFKGTPIKIYIKTRRRASKP